MGGGGGEEVRRAIPERHYLSEPVQPVLAGTDAVHLQAIPGDADPEAGRGLVLLQWQWRHPSRASE